MSTYKNITQNAAGIGGQIEELSGLGAFVTITGGDVIQRRHARDYCKAAHETKSALNGHAPDADDLVDPLIDVSVPKRVSF